MNERMLDLLYHSFDGELTAGERKMLEDALAASEELRRERNDIMTMRKRISTGGPESFSPFFIERVMQRVATLTEAESGSRALQEWLVGAFKRVAIAGAAVAIGLVVFNLVQTEDVSFAAALGMSEISLEEMLELPVDSILEGLS
jgi:anti-sigma factor RsiW